MASGPMPKRPRLMCLSNMHNISRENAMEIARRAMNQPFPWSSVVPKEVQEWTEAFALAHNTRPEFVFMGSLVSTAAIMGPKAKIRVFSTYQEPTNLYVICLADPGAGKITSIQAINDRTDLCTERTCIRHACGKLHTVGAVQTSERP